MLKKIVLMVGMLLIAHSLLADNLYVNGATGNDSLAIANGSTAFKMIQTALDNSKPGDKIIIEGQNKNKQIIYSERLIIEKGSIKLVGENNPLLQGKNITNAKNNNIRTTSAIFINNHSVSISGLTIKNFNEKNIPKSLQSKDKNLISPGDVDNAAIYSAPDMIGLKIHDNIIENCDFGIYLNSPVQCRVELNKINLMESGSNNDKAGIGIALVSGGIGMEENVIKDNIISNATEYGIAFGGIDMKIDAEASVIENNKITSCGKAGMALYDFEGIVDIRQNEFKDNESALFFGGTPIDAIIKDNKFGGSKSKIEVYANEKYDPALLYRLWQDYDNDFAKPTFAISDLKINEIVKTGEYTCIFNDEAEARKYLDEKKNRIVNK
jgi:nitrous oxidase accessory protein NosD